MDTYRTSHSITGNDYETKYNHLLDLAGVMIITIDTNCNVTLINKKGCEILGLDEEDVLGKNWFDNFMFKENISKTKYVFEQFIKGNIQPLEYNENPIKTKNGKRYILWHNSVIKDPNGKITGIFSSGEDITIRTELKEKLEAQAQMFNTAFKISPIATFVINLDGSVIDVNHKAEKMLEAPKSTIVGMNLEDFTHPDDVAICKKIFTKSILTKKAQKVRKRYITSKGKIVVCDATLNYIDRNGGSYFIAQALDITEKESIKNTVMDTLNELQSIVKRRS